MDELGSTKKKTLGRRKIPIQKIDKKSSRSVTFSKRRKGLFKKAAELCILCGAQIAILVKSPAGKSYSFAHPSPDSLIHRFLLQEDGLNNTTTTMPNNGGQGWLGEEIRVSDRSNLDEVWKKLEGGNGMERRAMENPSGLWWDMTLKGMGLEELEEYASAMEGLKENVERRIGEMEKMNETTSSGSTDGVFVENPVQVFGPPVYSTNVGLFDEGCFEDFLLPGASLDYYSFPSYDDNSPLDFTSSCLLL